MKLSTSCLQFFPTLISLWIHSTHISPSLHYWKFSRSALVSYHQNYNQFLVLILAMTVSYQLICHSWSYPYPGNILSLDFQKNKQINKQAKMMSLFSSNLTSYSGLDFFFFQKRKVLSSQGLILGCLLLYPVSWL